VGGSTFFVGFLDRRKSKEGGLGGGWGVADITLITPTSQKIVGGGPASSKRQNELCMGVVKGVGGRNVGKKPVNQIKEGETVGKTVEDPVFSVKRKPQSRGVKPADGVYQGLAMWQLRGT